MIRKNQQTSILLTYLISGLVLGAIAAVLVFFFVFGFLIGLGWLYIFGDSPGPRAAFEYPFQLIVTIFSIGSGLATWVTTTYLFYVQGKKVSKSSNHSAQLQKSRKFLILTLTVFGVFILINIGRGQLASHRQQLQEQIQRERQQLQDSIHQITKIGLSESQPHQVELIISGKTPREYNLTISIRPYLTQNQQLDLPAGSTPHSIILDTNQLLTNYRLQNLDFSRPTTGLGAGVDRQPLTLTVTLTDAQVSPPISSQRSISIYFSAFFTRDSSTLTSLTQTKPLQPIPFTP